MALFVAEVLKHTPGAFEFVSASKQARDCVGMLIHRAFEVPCMAIVLDRRVTTVVTESMLN